MTASELARLITVYVNSKGDSVSPKKLQKLVYYVEAWHLVHLHASLVDEEFEAWVHGPVVPELYQELKDHGWNNISLIDDEHDKADEIIDKIAYDHGLSDDQVNLIFSVLDRYGGLDSFELELLTHSETPWQEARGNKKPHERCRKKISKRSMKVFYTDQLTEYGETWEEA